jgi:hypothetical protein
MLSNYLLSYGLLLLLTDGVLLVHWSECSIISDVSSKVTKSLVELSGYYLSDDIKYITMASLYPIKKENKGK